MMKNLFAFLMAAMLLALCACSGTNTSAPADDSNVVQGDNSSGDAAEVQYDYQLKAGETTEVYDVTFDEMVTVTVDPTSTRDGSIDLRSGIYFDNCTFNGGLTILGDYHAMVSLGGGCSFGDGATVTCKEVTPGAGEDMGLEDNFVKVFVSCEDVTVETEYAVGVVTDGPDFVFNGTTYSKEELAPDAAILGVYSICENDGMSYMKLAIGEDDSVEVLD